MFPSKLTGKISKLTVPPCYVSKLCFIQLHSNVHETEICNIFESKAILIHVEFVAKNHNQSIDVAYRV